MSQIKWTNQQKPSILPGLLFILIIAIIAYIIGLMFPVLGGAISGIILGILIQHFIGTKEYHQAGIDFTLKKLLKVAIVLLGFSFSLTELFAVGKYSLLIVIVSVIAGLTFTYYIGRLFGLHGNTSLLIGAGTAICGATAIVTLSPVIKAKEEELTYAVNTIFAFNVLAILLFPLIAQAVQMPDQYFGIWAGAAIHDTSSVVAAGYAYSDEAGQVSVVVKLARTLMLIPLVLIVAFVKSVKDNRLEGTQEGEKVRIWSLFPMFILVFVLVVLFNSFVTLPEVIPHTASQVAKFFIVMVMVSVGLKTDIGNIRQVGFRPLFVGLIASVLISVVSLGLVYKFI